MTSSRRSHPNISWLSRANVNDASECSTSVTLVKRASAKDSEAWRRLARLYAPLVYAWTRKTGLDGSDAEDVVQEVFRAVFGGIERFRHDEPGSSFRGWLWTITRNQVRMHFRNLHKRPDVIGGSAHRQRIEQSPFEPELQSPEVVNNLVHRALQLVKGDFTDKTWNAFWRLTVEGQTAKEIAADLGMNSRSVRQAKYRVLTRLRQELADS